MDVSGQLEAAWRRLWAVQRRLGGVLGRLTGVLEASWRHLGHILGRLGGILDVSQGKYRKKVECNIYLGGIGEAKMEVKFVKIHV